MSRKLNPSYEEIKRLALQLYFGKNPTTLIQPSDEELKLKGYWTNARLILQGKKKMPKYAQKAFYSNFAHSERLRELLEWAKTNEQIQKCLKRNAMKKAERLIKQESIERYGIGSNYAVKYAKLVIVRLRKGSEIYTEWGIL